MKAFILHWIGGKTEKVHGNTIREAFTNAGYGAKALQALDYYEEEKSEYGPPNLETISMGPFGRKNLIQAGFIAGMRFAGLDKDHIKNEKKLQAMKEALMDVFESHGLTREIEF